MLVDQSDFPTNAVGSFLIGVEKVAPQQWPSEVRTCAVTLGARTIGIGARASVPFAFACTLALSGTRPCFSSMPMMPSGAPVFDLNFKAVADVFQHGGVPHAPMLGCP